MKELKVTRNRLQLETALEQSGLPEAAQILIRQVAGPAAGVPGHGGGRAADCGAEGGAGGGGAAQRGDRDAADHGPRAAHGRRRLQEALDWCLGVQGGPMPPPSLRNIRDVYLAITGDVDFYGVFNPEHAQLAAASTTTLPGLARTASTR